MSDEEVRHHGGPNLLDLMQTLLLLDTAETQVPSEPPVLPVPPELPMPAVATEPAQVLATVLYQAAVSLGMKRGWKRNHIRGYAGPPRRRCLLGLSMGSWTRMSEGLLDTDGASSSMMAFLLCAVQEQWIQRLE